MVVLTEFMMGRAIKQWLVVFKFAFILFVPSQEEVSIFDRIAYELNACFQPGVKSSRILSICWTV